MASDQLSRVFDLVEVRGVLSGGFAARGPWVCQAPISGLKFFAVVAGAATLTAGAVDGSLDLVAGDVVVVNDRPWVTMRGGGNGEPRQVHPTDGVEAFRALGVPSAITAGQDVVVGGHVDLDPVGRALLRRGLPPLSHVHDAGTTGTHLRGSIHRLVEEVTGDRLGAAYAIRQHTQLLLLEVLRSVAEQADLPPGWLRALADPRLRPAFDAIHSEPARSWSLPGLAGTVAMSRTAFAERFRDVAGVPPITYLNKWRIMLAQRALRDRETRVGALAAELGYASESAFSTAFKRETGVSPLRYRQQVREATSRVAR